MQFLLNYMLMMPPKRSCSEAMTEVYLSANSESSYRSGLASASWIDGGTKLRIAWLKIGKLIGQGMAIGSTTAVEPQPFHEDGD
jgi:hypothetical protein